VPTRAVADAEGDAVGGAALSLACDALGSGPELPVAVQPVSSALTRTATRPPRRAPVCGRRRAPVPRVLAPVVCTHER
jgi:hypothetical protein